MRPITRITIAGIRLAIVVLVAYWGLMAVGTHLPAELDFSPNVYDKAKHFSAFAMLALMLCYVTNSPRLGLRFGAIVVVAVLYAAIDEWTQSFVPGRVCDRYDFFADCLGILAGTLAYGLPRWWWRDRWDDPHADGSANGQNRVFLGPQTG